MNYAVRITQWARQARVHKMSATRKQWIIRGAIMGSVVVLATAVAVLAYLLSAANGEDGSRARLVIDNDAGGDDAMAILLALLYEKHFDGPQVVGLTTGVGNAPEDNVNTNNQRILKLANRQDVPIYRGAKGPILFAPENCCYYGVDGLGDTGELLDGLVAAQDLDAVNALITLSKKYKDKLTVLTIGTLTNVALTIRIDPEFLNRIGHLHIGAGHIHSDINPNPEFNALMDVEAYKIVMQNARPDKVTIFPYSQTKESLNITRAWREEVLGRIDNDIMQVQNKFEQVSIPKNEFWHSLDPATMAVHLRPDLVEQYKYSKNDIVSCGEGRGLTNHTLVEQTEANVRVVYKVKREEYKQFLLNVFSKGGE